MVANVAAWSLAYVGAVIAAGFAFTLTMFLSDAIYRSLSSTAGATSFEKMGLSSFFVALPVSAFIGFVALPVALVASAVPEARGRKRTALFYGIAGVLAGLFGLLTLLGIDSADYALKKYVQMLPSVFIGGTVGGLSMWKLRASFLGPL